VDIDQAISISNAKPNTKFDLMANDSKEQRELIERAFSAPNVEEEFEEEKNQLIEKEENKGKEVQVELPGWGSWSGEGIKAKQKKQEKPKEKKKISRKDDTLKNVVINEKKIAQASAKYTLPEVPFPFTSSDQYERSLLNPLGRDWNTENSFRKLIQPSVSTKKGVIIEPLDMGTAKVEFGKKPNSDKNKKENKKERRKLSRSK